MLSILLKIKSDVTVNETGEKATSARDREECARKSLSEAVGFELSLTDEKEWRPGGRMIQKEGTEGGMDLAFWE